MVDHTVKVAKIELKISPSR